MANQQTGNYQLSQWESTDRIQMEDFNSDNAKIDAALKTVADAVATKAEASALAALPQTSIEVGILSNYTGSANVTIDLGKQPKMVIIGCRLGFENVITANLATTICGHAVALPGYPGYRCTNVDTASTSTTICLQVTNTGFTVYSGLSSKLAPYYYLAIL